METEQVIDKSAVEIKVSARRAWPGGEDESPEKRARVGGVYVGALYSPTEDVIVSMRRMLKWQRWTQTTRRASL